MGIYADLLASAKTFDAVPPSDGEDRSAYAQIDALRDRQGDIAYPTGFAERDEVQSIGAATGASSGTYTITVNLASGQSFTTAAIAHSANAATIQTAINTAATSAGITGWTNGDIVVGGGPLHTTAVTLTFSGNSVDAVNQPLASVNSGSLVGGVAGPVAATNEGQANRPAWAVLAAAGVVAGTPPAQGTSTVLTAASNRANNPYYPDQGLIRALAKEAAIADGNTDVETQILKVAGLSVDGR